MMLGYYLELALRSLRRNVMLTALTVAAVGAGIGASMTMLTTLRAMSGNPIPEKSSQLFVPLIDVWGPDSRQGSSDNDWLPNTFTYRDAVALTKAHMGLRQAAMFRMNMDVSPISGTPFEASGRATYGDFFAMFDVPFRDGTPWGQKEDDGHENVVVLGSKLAQRLFPQTAPIGRTVSLDGRDYRVIGVARPWTPSPRFYDLFSARRSSYGDSEDFFIPFSNAIDRQLRVQGATNCNGPPPPGWEARLNSECVWLQFWVELPTPAQVRRFHTFLQGYAAEQRQSGRLHWPPMVKIYDVMGWIEHNQVLPESVRLNVVFATGFLLVCLVNSVGLILAKFSGRGVELGLRRALGASRFDVFLQCLSESVLVGLLGGVLGLGLTSGGLWGLRLLRGVTGQGSAAIRLYTLDWSMVLITLLAAMAATVACALYPALRASRVQPAWQLKAQ
jgi:putative ABC transport system permease protein